MAEAEYTDPPGMPEDERMTPAEFRVVREFLGLTGDWLAQHLKVNPRTVRAWEQGRYPIPDGVRLAIEDLEARTGEFIGGCVEKLLDLPDPAVITYRSDTEYHAANPDIEMPASWHRAVCARIALEVPGLSIVYADAHVVDGATA
ncbi:helix-turn-helix domain-containing protein [Amycolatopsis sp. NPDC058986]|uniref:helix-turn-helix domain-containing protein n=1 Tax=unclassified Amycolatopsis TaxID=2618356 RepID=UPI00366C0DDF